MGIYYITFRSVTPAQRGEQLLRKNGFRCVIQRTPRWMQENGCGYCIRLSTNRIADAVRQLEAEGMDFRKVYRLNQTGDAEEISL